VLRTYLVLSLPLVVGTRWRLGSIDIHRSLELCDKLLKLLGCQVQETTILVNWWHLIKGDI
jgi:hypothetical protein